MQIVNPERQARKKLLKKLNISNKKFKKLNKLAQRTGEKYHFIYDNKKQSYVGTNED